MQLADEVFLVVRDDPGVVYRSTGPLRRIRTLSLLTDLGYALESDEGAVQYFDPSGQAAGWLAPDSGLFPVAIKSGQNRIALNYGLSTTNRLNIVSAVLDGVMQDRQPLKVNYRYGKRGALQEVSSS